MTVTRDCAIVLGQYTCGNKGDFAIMFFDENASPQIIPVCEKHLLLFQARWTPKNTEENKK